MRAWVAGGAFMLLTASCASQPPPAPRPGPVRPPVVVDEDVRRIIVHGNSLEAIGHALQAEGIIDVEGRYVAPFASDLRWTYDYTEHAESCSMDSAQVHIQAHYVQLDWVEPPDASDALKRDWYGYAVMANRVERARFESDLGGARELQRNLLLLEAKVCTALERRAAHLGSRLRDAIRSGHGRLAREAREGGEYGGKQHESALRWPPRVLIRERD